MSRKTDAAFGIIPIWQNNNTHHFLLIQHQAGHWAFPKGHADPGETAIETARREFEEETGILEYAVVEEVSFQEAYRFTRDQQLIDKTVTYFPAFVYSTSVTCQADEIKDYAWLSYEAAVERVTFDQARRVLAAVKAYLDQDQPSRP